MNLSLIRFFVKQFEENDGRCGTTGRLSVQLSFKLVKQVLMFAGFTFCSMTLAQVSVPPIPAYWTGWDAVTHYSSEAAACVGSMITRNSTCCAANPITAFTSMSGKECYGDETILSNGSTYSNIHYADATAVAAHCTDGYTLSGSNCIANSQPVLAVNVGPSACPVTKGNPINIGIGNKYQMESDYGIADDASLGFYRQYNSINPIA
ncbi:MAG: hypothetical protein ACXWJK_05900, partial [Burkholderiaceae bacterium]